MDQPIRLVYHQEQEDEDGGVQLVRRTVAVPEGRVIGENVAAFGTAYFPLEGVTVPAGGLWHWEPTAANESPRIRVLSDDEIAERVTRGLLATGAVEGSDPVTGISREDIETADGPIPQVALPESVEEG